MSTIFTLGTDNGIILIRVHTEANDLHLFAAFVRRDDFTVRLHWTNWEPGQEETIINHNGIDVPVDSKCYNPGPHFFIFSTISHHLFCTLGHLFPTCFLTRCSDRHPIT